VILGVAAIPHAGYKPMSWKILNKILGLAITDKVFAEKLLKEPQEALSAYGIRLPDDELKLLCECQAQSLHELSQQLVKKLGPEASERSG
jgi:hypothetical protein